MIVDVRTQAEMDAALAAGNTPRCTGGGYFRASDQATVEAWGQATVRASGQATVRAWGQATVRASGQATVRASGQATVRASGQATVRASDQATVRASDQATVRASDQATVEAGARVPVHDAGPRTTITGGIVIDARPARTAEEWCAIYGVEVDADGIVVVYKAVRDDWRSSHGALYEPGSTPEALDWDGGKEECGGGLHFAPAPWIARQFDRTASRFVGCPVRLDEIAVYSDSPAYPHKVKAPRVVAPGCFEVDADGAPVAPVEASS